MTRTVCVETTVIGWEIHRPNFDVFISQFVIDECFQGDSTAAGER